MYAFCHGHIYVWVSYFARRKRHSQLRYGPTPNSSPAGRLTDGWQLVLVPKGSHLLLVLPTCTHMLYSYFPCISKHVYIHVYIYIHMDVDCSRQEGLILICLEPQEKSVLPQLNLHMLTNAHAQTARQTSKRTKIHARTKHAQKHTDRERERYTCIHLVLYRPRTL